jgi:3-dehydroquinate dehydratase
MPNEPNDPEQPTRPDFRKMELEAGDIAAVLATPGLDPDLAARIKQAAKYQTQEEQLIAIRAGTKGTLNRLYKPRGAK